MKSGIQKKIHHGLKENLGQFLILVLINGFVGAMVGLERSIFPQFAAEVFGLSSKTAILSFITAFGITKAFTNYLTGRLANRFGRKNLLIGGWVIALPVPVILLLATSWDQVVFANILLGVSQGLTWSSTVVMKIDLVGEKNRGLAMGLNEFAGYFAVGLTAFFTGYLAANWGVRPYPFYLGIGIALGGLILSIFAAKDTREHAHRETAPESQHLTNVFRETTFQNKTLSSVTQAGLVNNLNDGMLWGLLPMLLLSYQYNTDSIGILTAIYPMVWGMAQIFTGKMADHFSHKKMLFLGMATQGVAIVLLPVFENFYFLAFIAVVLGLGTATVYPTFLTAIASATKPLQRAESIGTFRLWRDLGYAIGAVVSGIMADLFSLEAAIYLIGLMTLASALLLKWRMPE